MRTTKFVVLSFILFALVISGCTSKKPVENGSNMVQHTINSKIIGGNVNITIYLPKGYNLGEKYPVLYALHGASGNEWQWFDDLNAGDLANSLIAQNKVKPLIIVCTKTLNSLSISELNHKKNDNPAKDIFEEYVCNELVPYIDANYNTIRLNRSRYIGGVSMGGFIALQIALHHPQLFGKVGGHSPASWIVDYSKDSFDQWLYEGEAINKSEDPRKVARDKGLLGLKVFLDCGESDVGIVDDTKKIYDALSLRGLDVGISIGKGDHNIEYWKANMEKYLEFYNGV